MKFFTTTGEEDSVSPIIVNNEFNGRSPIPSDFQATGYADIIFKADDLLAGRELYIYKQKKTSGAFFRII
ncbi:MAG: hypothetical protein IPG79_21740 [Saprospiraceae bacterium]|nr:hypothetical protein [Saprospiraceae bacterium]